MLGIDSSLGFILAREGKGSDILVFRGWMNAATHWDIRVGYQQRCRDFGFWILDSFFVILSDWILFFWILSFNILTIIIFLTHVFWFLDNCSFFLFCPISFSLFASIKISFYFSWVPHTAASFFEGHCLWWQTPRRAVKPCGYSPDQVPGSLGMRASQWRWHNNSGIITKEGEHA